MKEQLYMTWVVLISVLIIINFMWLVHWLTVNCIDENRMINNNYITWLGFKLSCDRSWNTQKYTDFGSNRSERDIEIDKIVTKACLDNWGMPKISNWDWDVICKYKD